MNKSKNAKSIMTNIGNLLSQDSTNDQEKNWLLTQTDNSELKDALAGLSTQDLKVLNKIGNQERVLIKSLPAAVDLSQPTISRMMNRLEKKNILEKYRTVKNNKEILVRLTPLGEKIADLHTQLDNHILQNVDNILSDYSDEEIEHFIEILSKIQKIKL